MHVLSSSVHGASQARGQVSHRRSFSFPNVSQLDLFGISEFRVEKVRAKTCKWQLQPPDANANVNANIVVAAQQRGTGNRNFVVKLTYLAFDRIESSTYVCKVDGGKLGEEDVQVFEYCFRFYE